MNVFKIGDVVRHKASTNQVPLLTVSYYSEDDVRCTYFQFKEQVFLTVKFHPDELEKAPV